MRVCVAVLLFLVLCGRPAFIGAERVHEVAEGGNVTVVCPFNLNGHTKIFCKNDCDKEENILVQTSENEACHGRYCIDYKVNGWHNGDIMYVTITKVTRTDSGRYQCVLKRYTRDGIHEFEIKVTNRNNGPLNPSYTSPSVQTEPGYMFVLLLTLIPVLIIISCVLVFYIKKKSQNGSEVSRHSEVVLYENCPAPAPASEPADSTYQTLSADTRDHNNIYSSLNTQPPSH